MENELFKINREKILNQMINGSVLVSFSRRAIEESVHPDKYDVNRNYLYITGVFEYENIVVLIKDRMGNKNSIIYINPYDEFKAKWVGAPLDEDTINEISGIEDIRYLEEFNEDLLSILEFCPNIYLDIETNDLNKALTEDQLFAKRLKERMPYLNIYNGRNLFKHARTTKHKLEIDMLKKAIEITSNGINSILSHIGPMFEYQLEAYFDFGVKVSGATGYSFPTIAASGANSCCLHYQDNNSYAEDGDLILFDLGASYNCYCADISRTYPISGKFTKRQREIYNIVLNGQKLVYESAKPGLTTRDLNNILIDYYKEELYKIGLIKEKTADEVRKYYYHGVSHHIGLDCHDLAEYKKLEAGAVISNEPGLYIEEEGIGIRIEDDMLITENGAEWLSPQILKDPDEIERYIKEHKVNE